MNKLTVELGTLIAGLTGALLSVGKSSSKRLRDNLLAIGAGVSSAFYLTPVVMGIFGIANENHRVQYGIAFLLGMLGLRGVEVLISYLVPILGENGNNKNNTPKNGGKSGLSTFQET